MRVLILDVGDRFTRQGFGSSALLEGPKGYVLLDCPDLADRAPVAEQVARAGLHAVLLAWAEESRDYKMCSVCADHLTARGSLGNLPVVRCPSCRADQSQPVAAEPTDG